MNAELPHTARPISAKDAELEKQYVNRTGRAVVVMRKDTDRVVVKALYTSHHIELSGDYPLYNVGAAAS